MVWHETAEMQPRETARETARVQLSRRVLGTATVVLAVILWVLSALMPSSIAGHPLVIAGLIIGALAVIAGVALHWRVPR
jgi:uncharacterized membrane protein